MGELTVARVQLLQVRRRLLSGTARTGADRRQQHIEVVQYELLEQSRDRFRFEQRGCMQACVGSAGSLIPPHEYHTIANPSPDKAAISLHVYSGEMTRCNTFSPDGEAGWYRREPRALGFD